jgi:hypothetical protein
MRNQLLASVGLAAAAISVSATAQQVNNHNNSAIKAPHEVNDGGPSRGANSFTQGQARGHVEHSGFTHVSTLTKDRNGVWRGTAMKGGRRVPVAVDFKGNVSTGRR